jgi:hypothetical protein
MTRRRDLVTVVALLSLLCATSMAKEPTSEITSNAIYQLAGSGDTLWMVTSAGINYAIADTGRLNWWGYETAETYATNDFGALHAGIAFGAGTAVICRPPVTPPAKGTQNALWVFGHSTAGISTVNISWERQSTPDTLQLDAIDASYVDGSFWLACLDGGIVRIAAEDFSSARVTGRALVPGRDTSWASTDFPRRIGSIPADAADRVRRVATSQDTVGVVSVWAVTARRIWRLDPDSTRWDSLTRVVVAASGDTVEVAQFLDVHARSGVNPPPLFALAAVIEPNGDTVTAAALLRYDHSLLHWTKVADAVEALTFGGGDTVYTVSGGAISAWIESSMSSPLPATQNFPARLADADVNIDVPAVSNVLYVPSAQGSGFLWVATTDGLYYSRDEHADEVGKVPFARESRAKKLAAGLSKTYFYPTILTPTDEGRSVGYFAYNLSKNANVTIRVYDWNMDLVKTVIRDQPRQKGKSTREGRSSVKREDLWDGTNQDGRAAAPGVYYYRITTNIGEHSFGKIVVAQ